MELIDEINHLKHDQNVAVFAHNYQCQEIQAVADFVGDTFALAIGANDIENEYIVFCGPDFMVETSAILNPDKVVIYANPTARCPMAAMCTAKDIEKMREKYPQAAVVGYMNTTAECKAKVDVCCGSRNCVEIVRNLDNKQVILLPDDNLAAYVQRCVPEKEIIPWPGFCVVHERIKAVDILELKNLHPKAEVLAHPECIPEVIDMATAVLSTDGMVEHVVSSPAKEFIVATETEIVNRLLKAAPSKTFFTIPKAICHTQKRVTLEDVIRALETLEPRVDLGEEEVIAARRPLERMLSMDTPSEPTSQNLMEG